MLDDVNRRFTEGRPADTLHDAGVLIHMFDNLEDSSDGWHVCRTGWCAGFDHMSCSLINAQLPVLFNYGVGIILSSATAYECSYTADGSRPRYSCLPV